jgi:hypothetical protein
VTPEERTTVLDYLAESRHAFLASIEDITAAQWTWRPAPDRWSVGETAEHIMLAEAFVFAVVQKALATAPSPDWEAQTGGQTQKLEAALTERRARAQAPERVTPRGGMTPTEVRERFLKQREAIEKFAGECAAPLKQYILNNPFFGPLNGYQWLIYAPLHTLRHCKQINEIKATVRYPS